MADIAWCKIHEMFISSKLITLETQIWYQNQGLWFQEFIEYIVNMPLSHITGLRKRIDTGHNFFQSVDVRQSPVYIRYIYCYHPSNAFHVSWCPAYMVESFEHAQNLERILPDKRVRFFSGINLFCPELSCTCPVLVRYLFVIYPL